jgi:hypothetical protein
VKRRRFALARHRSHAVRASGLIRVALIIPFWARRRVRATNLQLYITIIDTNANVKKS